MSDNMSTATFANLCPITVKDGAQWVDARKLHAALESKQHFTDWIKSRVDNYGFVEGEEFFINLGKTSPQGGRPSTEYQISLDMAKELCMVENTEIGRLARKYFIECEKRYRNLCLNETGALTDMAITERLLRIAGLPPNQIALGVNNVLKKNTGRDFLADSQIALPAPSQKAILTPTQIGCELGGISPNSINKILLALKFQRKLNSGAYEATEKGAPYSIMIDQGRSHNSGAPVTSLRWYSPIVEILRMEIANSAAISAMVKTKRRK